MFCITIFKIVIAIRNEYLVSEKNVAIHLIANEHDFLVHVQKSHDLKQRLGARNINNHYQWCAYIDRYRVGTDQSTSIKVLS